MNSECLFCTLPGGTCTNEARPGILCKECNYRGYYDITQSRCVCTSRFENPVAQCNSTIMSKEIVSFNASDAYFSCSCYTDFNYGFWKLSTVPYESTIYTNSSDIKIFKYGLPDPQVCDSCFNQYYGPPPGEQTPSILNPSIKACNSIGGLDPNDYLTRKVYKKINNQEDSSEYGFQLNFDEPITKEEDEPVFHWKQCNGHGIWNSTLNYCICDLKWKLNELPLKGFDDVTLYSCTQCSAAWGPPVPSQQFAVQSQPDYCSSPWTPDPIDGQMKICSGHGDYQLGECHCYDNSTHGHWKLGLYEIYDSTIVGTSAETYETKNIRNVVLTCIGCMSPYSPHSYCMDATPSPTDQPSETPTDSPTKYPTLSPTKNPTKSPSGTPTRPPSLNPSHSPSKSPSESPTDSPTDVPSHPPTKNPSINPSHTPTRSPSKSPTDSPTDVPSHPPTKNPSINPSHAPTRSPSSSPTRTPSDSPSKSPTKNPTSTPTTRTPTYSPSISPTTGVTVLRLFFLKTANGEPGTVNAQCELLMLSRNVPYRFSVGFLSTTAVPLSNFHLNYKFPTSAPIKAGNTDTELGIWQTAVLNPSPTRSLFVSIDSTGIRPSPSPTRFWSGASSDSIPSQTCASWTQIFSTGGYGTSTSASSNWIVDGASTCSDNYSIYCLTGQGTSTPTRVPTRTPTKNPTANPSRNPTKNPTANPSLIPTKNPSVNPSLNPTKNPSVNPTHLPSRSPTNRPTRSPTKDPSKNPTKNPTTEPTKNPTTDPTTDPTKEPTKNPTKEPTKTPTKDPTKNPTVSPTTLSPSKTPSRDPTKTPTKDPTKNPTTDPTRTPTTSGSVILFYAMPPSTGNIVNPESTCVSFAESNSIPYRHAVPLLNTASNPILLFHVKYMFSSDAPIRAGLTGIDIGNWQNAVLDTYSSFLTTALQDAGVLPTSSFFWSGGYNNPSSFNCLNFASASSGVNGIVGNSFDTDSAWLASAFPTCNTPNPWICMFVQGTATPTKAPTLTPTIPPTTKTPTKAPTIAPTTRSPTLPPTTSTPTSPPTQSPTVPFKRIYLLYYGNSDGNIGSQATTDGFCNSYVASLGVEYTVAVSFLSYTGRRIQDFPTVYMFDASSTVYSYTSGDSLGVWGSIVPGSISMTLKDADIIPSGESSLYWNGGSGLLTPRSCNGWSTNSAGVKGDRASAETTASTWIYGGDGNCDVARPWLCLFTQSLTAPSQSPTPFPTDLPTTRSPTSPPTTKSPTKAPTSTPTTQSPTTQSPTQPPTTKSPTKSPTASPTNYNIIIYASPGVAPSTSVVRGNLGTRAQTNAYCAQATIPPAPTPSCLTSPTVTVTKPPVIAPGTERAFLSYTSDTLRDLHSDDKRVYVARPTPTGHVYYDMLSTWGDMFTPTPTPTETKRRLQTFKGSLALALGFASYNIWTGANSDGTKSTNNCVDWTSVGAGVTGMRGDMTAQNSRIVNVGGDATCNSGTSIGVLCTGRAYVPFPSPSPTTFAPATPTGPPTYDGSVLLYPGGTTSFSSLASRLKSTAMCVAAGNQIEQNWPEFMRRCRFNKWFGSFSSSDTLVDSQTSGFNVIAFGDVSGSIATLNPTPVTWSTSPTTGTMFSPTPTPKTVVTPSTFVGKWAVMGNDFQFISTQTGGVIFTGSNIAGGYQSTSPTPTPVLPCTQYSDFSNAGTGVRAGVRTSGTTTFYSSTSPGCNTIANYGCSCIYDVSLDRPYAILSESIPSGAIIMFSDNSISNRGDIAQSREILDKFCAITMYHIDIGDNYQPSLESLLMSPTMFVSLVGDDIQDFPTKFNFPTSAPVMSLNGNIIADSWQQFVDGSLLNSLFDATVFEYNTPTTYWTNGLTNTPSAGPTTCTSMNSASGSLTGRVGSITSTSSTAIDSGTLVCSTSTRMMCMTIKL